MEQLRDAVAPPEEAKETALSPQRAAPVAASPPAALPEAKESPPPPAVAPCPPYWRKIIGQPGVPLPLFHRTWTKPNGEGGEIMWGPAAVHAIRWIVVLILGAFAILKSGSGSELTETVLKWLASLR
jgi:hypothetical protein